jgi:hypothetical protein
MSDEVTDEEVINAMVDGGRKLCEYAIEQWTKDKYGMGHETNQAYIQRWRKISSRMGELGKEWKRAKKQEQGR